MRRPDLTGGCVPAIHAVASNDSVSPQAALMRSPAHIAGGHRLCFAHRLRLLLAVVAPRHAPFFAGAAGVSGDRLRRDIRRRVGLGARPRPGEIVGAAGGRAASDRRGSSTFAAIGSDVTCAGWPSAPSRSPVSPPPARSGSTGPTSGRGPARPAFAGASSSGPGNATGMTWFVITRRNSRST